MSAEYIVVAVAVLGLAWKIYRDHRSWREAGDVQKNIDGLHQHINRVARDRFANTILIVLTSAILALGLVVLFERVEDLEDWTAKADVLIKAPRPPGSEKTLDKSGDLGDWSEAVFCPDGYYVCGMKQRVQSPQGCKEDDTAMNAVAFFCCPLKPTKSVD